MWNLMSLFWEFAEIWFSLWTSAAWRGFVLLSIAGLIVLSMRSAAAALRHWILLLAVGSLLVLPLLSTALPTWSILPAWPEAEQSMNSHLASLPETPPFVTTFASEDAVTASLDARTHSERQGESSSINRPSPESGSARPRSNMSSIPSSKGPWRTPSPCISPTPRTRPRTRSCKG